MKTKFMCCVLALFLLAGCGTKTVEAPTPTPSPETFGQAVETPTETPVETAAPEQQGPASAAEPEETTQNLDELAALSLCYIDYLDGLSYNRQDPVMFWRAVGTLIGSEAGGSRTLSDEALRPYVTALFGTYEEQYPSLGEENPLVMGEYRDGHDYYTVQGVDFGEFAVSCGPVEQQPDGSFLRQVELQKDGETKAVYTLTLEPNPDATSRFQYAVTGMKD